MAHTFDETLAAVAEMKTVEDGLIALTDSLKAKVDAIVAGSLTPEQQAALDQIFNQIAAAKTAAAEALLRDTPAAPATP